MIDNTQSELVGGWTPSTYKVNYYKTDYLYRRAGTGANRVVWRPTLVRGGTYAVYYWLPNGATDRAPDATFTVRHATGAAQLRIDQRVSPGGIWRALGSFVFLPGTASTVELTDRASGTYVIADAVKFVFTSDVVPTPAVTIVDNDAATLKGTWTVSSFEAELSRHELRVQTKWRHWQQHGPMDTAYHSSPGVISWTTGFRTAWPTGRRMRRTSWPALVAHRR